MRRFHMPATPVSTSAKRLRQKLSNGALVGNSTWRITSKQRHPQLSKASPVIPSNRVNSGTHTVEGENEARLGYRENGQEYEPLNPMLCEIGTGLIQALSEAKVELLSETVSALVLPNDINCIEGRISRNVIFVRSFYPHLLHYILSHKRAVLTGAPGIGKTWFQIYYLASLVNPVFSSQIYNNQKTPFRKPKVVVRQAGKHNMTIFHIQSRIAYWCEGGQEVLQSLDPETTVYLFEPGSDIGIEPCFETHQGRTLATMPMEMGSSEKCIQMGATQLFLPSWEAQDLLTVSDYLRDKGGLTKAQKDLYQRSKVAARAAEFCGSFSQVFPTNHREVEDLYRRRADAIHSANVGGLADKQMSEGDIETAAAAFLVQLNVLKPSTKKKTYPPYRLDPLHPYTVNKTVENLLHKTRVDSGTIIDEDYSFRGQPGWKIFEVWLSLILTSPHLRTFRIRLDEKPRALNSERRDEGTRHRKMRNFLQWIPLDCGRLALEKTLNALPPLSEMQYGILYYPQSPNAPVLDMAYKEKSADGKKDFLVGFQVTRTEGALRTVKRSTLMQFLNQMGLCDVDQVKFILVPLPVNVGRSRVAIVEKNASSSQICARGALLEQKTVAAAKQNFSREEVNSKSFPKAPVVEANRSNPAHPSSYDLDENLAVYIFETPSHYDSSTFISIH